MMMMMMMMKMMGMMALPVLPDGGVVGAERDTGIVLGFILK